jgi:hypothetical protein
VLLEFIFGLIAESFLFFFIPESKFEKNVEKLKQEDWFVTLNEDYRYNYIIWNNSKVKRFISKSNNLNMLLIDDVEQKKFIELIKQEHLKFISH